MEDSRSSVFVSYCHEDVSKDDPRLGVFLDALEKASGGRFDVEVDLHQGLGSDVERFMSRINKADAVIALLSPLYNGRVLERKECGVYKEFRWITSRLDRVEAEENYERTFIFIPLVFAGNFDNSCPERWRRYFAGSLQWLDVVPKSNPPTVLKGVRPQLLRLVSDIVERVSAIGAVKSQSFLEAHEEKYRWFLFEDTKSRWDRPGSRAYLEKAFVKTKIFLQSRRRDQVFLVGRKGAGKSTLIHVIPQLTDPPPQQVIPLDFEQVRFEVCFNILRKNPGVSSDIEHVFSPLRAYQFLWDGFLHLFLLWRVWAELPEKEMAWEFISGVVPEIEDAASDTSERSAVATWACFIYAFEKLVEVVDGLARSSRLNLAQAVSILSPSYFRRLVFGDKMWESLHRFLVAERRKACRYLVTADGFDVLADDFVQRSDSNVEKLRFQEDLLLALFQVTLHGGPSKIDGGPFYGCSDFVLAIPFDRFVAIRNLDRDRYQYRHGFTPLSWTGIELSALVRKRLAMLGKIGDPKGPPLDERLRRVMAAGYGELPEKIVLRGGSSQVSMDLFLYVLRHTFWRPRDVLWFYSALLAAARRYRDRGDQVSEGFVRQVVASRTRGIIEDEFLKEFDTVFRNIREIIESLRDAEQVLDWEKLGQILEHRRFEVDLPEGLAASLEWKVEVLFEIGLLGVLLDGRTAERLGVFRQVFSFNSRPNFLETLGRDSYRHRRFVIHPVFCEYLHLDTRSNPELILPLSWQDLYDHEDLFD